MRHQTDTFLGGGSLTLHMQRWLPEERERPKAAVVVSHGYAEHSGRYAGLAEFLVSHGYGVYALDHRGHGRSEGERANIRVFREYVADLVRFTERVREIHPRPPRFLLGHSVGGAVALQMVLEQPERVDGLILSGAYLQDASPTPPLLKRLAGPVSRLAPSLPVQKLDTSTLSRQEEVVRAYENDPLVYHGRVKARLGAELLDTGDYLLARAESVRAPVLIMHGGDDRLAHPDGSRKLYNRIGSEDKTLKIYEGFYHEIFNDLGREEPLEDLLEWLEAHPHLE